MIVNAFCICVVHIIIVLNMLFQFVYLALEPLQRNALGIRLKTISDQDPKPRHRGQLPQYSRERERARDGRVWNAVWMQFIIGMSSMWLSYSRSLCTISGCIVWELMSTFRLSNPQLTTKCQTSKAQTYTIRITHYGTPIVVSGLHHRITLTLKWKRKAELCIAILCHNVCVLTPAGIWTLFLGMHTNAKLCCMQLSNDWTGMKQPHPQSMLDVLFVLLL